MYQLISIFVGASVIILGWVAASSQPEAVTRDLVAIVGSLAVVLVGVATLLKHRLRYYNKLREVYLRRLETLLLERNGVKASWGLHNFMRKAASAAPTGPRNVSFHAAIDIYYFIYILIWALLYVWKTWNCEAVRRFRTRLVIDNPFAVWYPLFVCRVGYKGIPASSGRPVQIVIR